MASPHFSLKGKKRVRYFLLLALGLLSPAANSAAIEKVLYHIHNTNPNSYQRTISNLENLKKGMPDKQLKIKILLQGKSLQLLNPALHRADLNQRFLKLVAAGAELETSRRNWQNYADKAQAIQKPALVPDIFKRIVELQQQGYRYITP